MTDHQEHEDEYTDEFVQTLELIWGDGFLSPGGAAEVAMALDGVDIAAKSVSQVGSPKLALPLLVVSPL